MSRVTITEALAEIKLIDSKVEKKRATVLQYLTRVGQIRDPLEKQGGSGNLIKQEQQAIRDLLERKVALRRAIQQANATSEATVAGVTRPISDWLVWKREVKPQIEQHLASIRSHINQQRQQAGQMRVGSEPAELLVNLDERALAGEIEKLAEITAGLDGQLSLKNATILIEV